MAPRLTRDCGGSLSATVDVGFGEEEPYDLHVVAAVSADWRPPHGDSIVPEGLDVTGTVSIGST